MHRFTTIRILVRALGVGAFVAALATPVLASGPSAAPSGSGSNWMPDVRERVVDLRERTKRAADDARVRRNQDAGQGQWWRVVAARPSQQVTR